MKYKMKRGFALGSISAVAVIVLVAIIAIAMGIRILTNLRTSVTSDTNATRVVNDGINTIEQMSSWLPTVGLVVMAGIIIGVVMWFGRSSSNGAQ